MNQRTFRPTEAQEKAIAECMAKNKITQSEAIRKILDEALNRQAILDTDNPLHCEALSYIDDHWECTWGRMGKTPDTKKIGKSDEARNNRCRSCKKTLDMTERLATMTEQLKRGKVIQLPSCRRGAKLNEDMTELLCPQIGTWRPIKERKKKTDPQPCHAKGSPPYYTRCEFIEWTQTVIKGKLPEGQNL